ncbi:hypothetical protein [Nocardioides abyssi]|uniref:Transmembrane protein n=1 Tax=Nocardioides abyssi TaxID=3058370 RepID=A0ABT8ESF5_9ACTN|nr:hypothetical protein [Nocardioides abyssi]MDN4161097.1 hypothetical protein [Nocardioides abyssi]
MSSTSKRVRSPLAVVMTAVWVMLATVVLAFFFDVEHCTTDSDTLTPLSTGAELLCCGEPPLHPHVLLFALAGFVALAVLTLYWGRIRTGWLIGLVALLPVAAYGVMRAFVAVM